MKKKKVVLCISLCAVVLCAFAVSAHAAETSHWWNAFSWFGDIANFVKSLVVPPENYFHNRLSRLNSMVNAKFSGVGQLYQTLSDFFYKLGDPAPAELVLSIPNNFLFSGFRGISVNLLSSAMPYVSFLRSFLSGACFIFTVIVCYNKLRTFFTEEA